MTVNGGTESISCAPKQPHQPLYLRFAVKAPTGNFSAHAQHSFTTIPDRRTWWAPHEYGNYWRIQCQMRGSQPVYGDNTAAHRCSPSSPMQWSYLRCILKHIVFHRKQVIKAFNRGFCQYVPAGFGVEEELCGLSPVLRTRSDWERTVGPCKRNGSPWTLHS